MSSSINTPTLIRRTSLAAGAALITLSLTALPWPPPAAAVIARDRGPVIVESEAGEWHDLSGYLKTHEFRIPKGIRMYVADDFELYAERIYIEGTLQARDCVDAAGVDGIDIRLIATESIEISGAVLGGRGPSRPQSQDAGFVRVQGGTGSSLYFESPATFVDGVVIAGRGGKGGPAAKGGTGGAIVFMNSFYTRQPKGTMQAIGGAGGLGGDSLPRSVRSSEGGDGGPVRVLRLDSLMADAGGSNLHGANTLANATRALADDDDDSCGRNGIAGARGGNATGGAGEPGTHGRHGTTNSPSGEHGGPGGRGADAEGQSGNVGGDGEYCCPDEPGGDGGDGGRGGDGTGGAGGFGGRGGDAWRDVAGWLGSGGSGGIGGTGGDGRSGAGGYGGTGGDGRPPGVGGGFGVAGKAIGGAGGRGGDYGYGRPAGSTGRHGQVGGSFGTYDGDNGSAGSDCDN